MSSDKHNIETLIRNRRSINRFKPQPVPTDVIRDAIDTAVWAPNHHLTEPWRFYLLGADTREQVCRLNAELVSAAKGEEAGRMKLEKWLQVPGWLVVTCQKSNDSLLAKEDYAACCCVIHNLSLVLWLHGIGMKWTTGEVIRADRFYDLVWVDREVEEVVGLIWYGYADEDPVSTRRNAIELTTELP
jgi:nitroreductase